MNILDGLPEEKLDLKTELALARKIQKFHREDDINELVLHSMREAFVYVKGVCKKKIADDEIFSMCWATLCRNARRYKARSGTRFLAFAKVGLRGAVCDYWVGLNTVRNAETVPLEVLTTEDDHGRGEVSTKEEITEPDFQVLHARELGKLLDSVMAEKLTEQEHMVTLLYYKSNFNFFDISGLLGFTRQNAQMILKKALKKLRCALGSPGELL